MIVIEVTESAHFYKKGEIYKCFKEPRWGCFVVIDTEELTLIAQKDAIKIRTLC